MCCPAVDLAGSERASATLNRGVRLHEGAKINRSLLALANCINALTSQIKEGKSSSRKAPAVNYRDSKLTHLLKSSLEGHCRLVIIANVNPNFNFYEDSHNTLKYANRAKMIKVAPLARVEAVGGGNLKNEVLRLHDEIRTLKIQLERAGPYPSTHLAADSMDVAGSVDARGSARRRCGNQRGLGCPGAWSSRADQRR